MRKGTKHSPQSLALMSDRAKKRQARPHTPETRAKISANNVARHELIRRTKVAIARAEEALEKANVA